MTVYASTTFAPTGSRATQAVSQLLAHGVRHIELGSNHTPEDGLEWTLGALGAQYVVHNYFPPPRDSFVVNIASPDPGLRARSLAHGMTCLAFAARIAAPLYTFHPGFLGDPVAEARDSRSYDFEFGTVPPPDYGAAFERFVEAAAALARRAEALGVRVAVESEGSVNKRDRLLLQRPDEFDALFTAVSSPAFGVNLNLGHLNLAANAFMIDRRAFVDRLASRIVAFELSHNDGVDDQHRPPVPGAWYWDIVKDQRFAHVPVIVECRETPIEAIAASVRAVEAARASAARHLA